MIKKILVVGAFSNNKYTYATSFYNSFKDLGYKVDLFNVRNKYIFNNKINNYLVNFFLSKKVFNFEPDLIFFIKSENIKYKTIKKIKNRSKAILVNFYPDNPFSFWNGNSNSEVLNSLIYYDYFLIWARRLVPILRSAGCKRVCYFPFGYDEDIFSEQFLDYKNLDLYKSDICFIGTWEKEREFWLSELIKKFPNLNLKIWGNLWQENLSKNSILKDKIMGKAIYQKDMIKAFKNSKIVLNFLRKQNFSSHNMRTLEVLATGSFLLTERSLEQSKFLFKENIDLACFDSLDELVDKINFYLQNDFLRQTIANKGFFRVKKFTLRSLLSNFIKKIEGEYSEESKT